jgi:hypothetical protein
VTAELLDLTENLIYITGILAQNTALQHESIGLGGSITNFTKAADTLVGVDTQYGAALGCSIDIYKTHVCDPQIAGVGTVVHKHNLSCKLFA